MNGVQEKLEAAYKKSSKILHYQIRMTAKVYFYFNFYKTRPSLSLIDPKAGR